MSNDDANDKPLESTVQGLRYARWAGHGLGIFLLVTAGVTLATQPLHSFLLFKAIYFIVYGSLMTFQIATLPDRFWKWAFGAFILLSMGFVFVMIATVMFAYIAAADRGERLGVPGFEGTLIFLALIQVPATLFQRNPDLLD